MSRRSRLPTAVDVTMAMCSRSVSGHHHEGVTPAVSDCEHAYVERAIERLLRLANYVELLAKALSVRPGDSAAVTRRW
jgi:hypothetical protein